MAVRFLAWSDLRRRWRTWLALALLIGLAGTAVLGAAAAARRTQSAYPRLIEHTNMFDVLVNPDDGEMDFGPVEALPQVAQAGRMAGGLVVPTRPTAARTSARSTSSCSSAPTTTAPCAPSTDPRSLDGPTARPDRVDEVFVEKTLADAARRWRVGSTMEVMSFGPDAFAALEAGEEPPRGRRRRCGSSASACRPSTCPSPRPTACPPSS